MDYYNITYHEKTLGQLFCDNSSEDIIKLLDQLCTNGNVIRKMGVEIYNVIKLMTHFQVETNLGVFTSETLVIGSGGLSIPQIGATGFGYNIARNFNINIIPTAPALVPLTLHDKDIAAFSSLAGNSFFSQTKIDKISFLENSLITHRGLSGPAILQISSYWNGKDNITINMLPSHKIRQLIDNNRSTNVLLSNFLSQFFSHKLALSICEMLHLNKQLSQLSNKEIDHIEEYIHNFKIKPSGTLGYKKAEITKGGINTSELSSKTMMSNKVEGLFFIGEVVDVSGWLGGYNFQWAWASAYVCANSL